MFTYEERTRLDGLPIRHDHVVPRSRARHHFGRIRSLPVWVVRVLRPRSRDIIIDLRDQAGAMTDPVPGVAPVADAPVLAEPLGAAATISGPTPEV